MSATIPPLTTPRGWRRLFWKCCPDCGQRFTNGIWQMSAVGYPMHYAMAHLGIAPFRRPA